MLRTNPADHERIAPPLPSGEAIFQLLSRVGTRFEISFERSSIVDHDDVGHGDPLYALLTSARRIGIFIQEMKFHDVDESIGLLQEGYAVVAAQPDGTFLLVDGIAGRRFAVSAIGEHVNNTTVSWRQLRDALFGNPRTRLFVAKRELDCDMISAAPIHGDNHHGHGHPKPFRRFLALLNLDRRDIWLIALFAFVAGILTLAIPLAVESLVNIVSWGTYLQPLVVLGLILLTCLGLAGVFGVLQIVLVEMIQRRQFVRIVSDLAHRFPRANQRSLVAEYPRELANRVFDIMTIQKATAVLLADGVTIVLTTTLGMVLLAFYHPFLLGFDIVLLIAMISITWLLGRGGVRTAIEESVAKYRVVHWLQDVIASPTVFKSGGGESLAIQRANQLTSDYILARSRQFRVLIRQIVFAISLQVIASTAVLALGGWLVIDGQLTLGQLVASELVVTVVVGAFAKAGKALEKYYDVMAGVDKVGHLVDIPADPRQELDLMFDGPAAVEWSDLTFERATSTCRVRAMKIEPGAKVAIVGDDADGRRELARTLGGLQQPTQGQAQISDIDSLRAAGGRTNPLVGYAGGSEIFHGTLQENVDLGRLNIGRKPVRQALLQVGLSAAVLRLPDDSQTRLQTGGYPLSPTEVAQLIIARTIVAKPRLLIIDGLLDDLSSDLRATIWKSISADDAGWTLVVTTNRDEVAALCDTQIAIRGS